MSIWIFFRLIGALALLMFGMKTMSDSLHSHHGDDRVFRQRWSLDLGASHLSHHGCQHRNHAHRLDHECRFLLQHHRLRMASLLPCHHPYL